MALDEGSNFRGADISGVPEVFDAATYSFFGPPSAGLEGALEDGLEAPPQELLGGLEDEQELQCEELEQDLSLVKMVKTVLTDADENVQPPQEHMLMKPKPRADGTGSWQPALEQSPAPDARPSSSRAPLTAQQLEEQMLSQVAEEPQHARPPPSQNREHSAPSSNSHPPPPADMSQWHSRPPGYPPVGHMPLYNMPPSGLMHPAGVPPQFADQWQPPGMARPDMPVHPMHQHMGPPGMHVGPQGPQQPGSPNFGPGGMYAPTLYPMSGQLQQRPPLQFMPGGPPHPDHNGMNGNHPHMAPGLPLPGHAMHPYAPQPPGIYAGAPPGMMQTPGHTMHPYAAQLPGYPVGHAGTLPLHRAPPPQHMPYLHMQPAPPHLQPPFPPPASMPGGHPMYSPPPQSSPLSPQGPWPSPMPAGNMPGPSQSLLATAAAAQSRNSSLANAFSDAPGNGGGVLPKALGPQGHAHGTVPGDDMEGIPAHHRDALLKHQQYMQANPQPQRQQGNALQPTHRQQLAAQPPPPRQAAPTQSHTQHVSTPPQRQAGHQSMPMYGAVPPPGTYRMGPGGQGPGSMQGTPGSRPGYSAAHAREDQRHHQYAGTLMSGSEVEHIMNMMYAALNPVGAYVDDYYYQAYVNKHAQARNALGFKPPGLRDLTGDASRLDPGNTVKFAALDGLGKFVLSNIRAPRMLMDLTSALDGLPLHLGEDLGHDDAPVQRTTAPTPSTSTKQASNPAASRPLEQEPRLAARIMIEDCLALLMDVDDVDRCFAAAGARVGFNCLPDGAEALLERRQLLCTGITTAFRLPSQPHGNQDGSDSSAGPGNGQDGVFLRIVGLSKGRSMLARALRLLLFSPVGAAGNGGPGNGMHPPNASDDVQAAAGQLVAPPGGADPQVLLWALLRNACRVFGSQGLHSNDVSTVTAMVDATHRLAAAAKHVVDQLKQPLQVLHALQAFLSGVQPSPSSDGTAAEERALPLGPSCLPPRPIAAACSAASAPATHTASSQLNPVPEDWLGDMLVGLLLAAERVGLKAGKGTQPAASTEWAAAVGKLGVVYEGHLRALATRQQAQADTSQGSSKQPPDLVCQPLADSLGAQCEEPQRTAIANALQQLLQP